METKKNHCDVCGKKETSYWMKLIRKYVCDNCFIETLRAWVLKFMSENP